MGLKKKGKANKLARMSEEEKLRYLQHRAAVEEEARRRKEQLVSTFLKNKLKREEAFTRLNSAKINQQWRQTLRQFKCKELRESTEILRNSFEVALSTKNRIIDNLLEDLKDSEAQHSMALEFYLEAMDKFIDLHDRRLKTVEEEYERERDRKVNAAQEKRRRIQQGFGDDSERLETVAQVTREELRGQLSSSQTAKGNRYDDLKFQLMTEIRILEEGGELEKEHIWRDIQDTVGDYKIVLEPIESEYNNLRTQDLENKVLYENNCNTICNLKDELDKMEKQFKDNVTDYESRVNDLTKETQEWANYYKELRKDMAMDNKMFEQKLTHLAVSSASTIDFLRSFSEKGDEILKLMSNCEKYLTEGEKLLPSFCRDLEGEETTRGGLDELKHFWVKCTELNLDCQSLRVHYNNFLTENKDLKLVLKQYLNVLAKPNVLSNIVI